MRRSAHRAASFDCSFFGPHLVEELGDTGFDAPAEPLHLGHGVVVARDAERTCPL